ncbi:type-F conjugative transfer system secretin TraK [Vibrio mediterranei]|uniref:type-F conjugative transfer system secretin TraK n=1 Tax=Vibrio TaxID=662 RepID=UPI004067EB84
MTMPLAQRFRYTSTILLTLISAHVFAENVPKATLHFADGDTIPISLSSVNINRLVVKNDKIINITCPPSFCTATGNKRDKKGSVSVKLNVSLPFTANVLTQKGRLFALFISPKATPSIVTEFIPSDLHLSQSSVFERDFDYPAAIASFTKSMMLWQRSRQPISGFSVHPVDPKTLPNKQDDPLPVIPQTIFVGKDYSGIIYEVHNRSQEPVRLTTAQFYSYAARSAALESFELPPNGKTHLYLVTGGGASDVR